MSIRNVNQNAWGFFTAVRTIGRFIKNKKYKITHKTFIATNVLLFKSLFHNSVFAFVYSCSYSNLCSWGSVLIPVTNSKFSLYNNAMLNSSVILDV